MELIGKIKITGLKITFTLIYLFFSTFCKQNKKQVYLMSARSVEPSIGLKLIEKELKTNENVTVNHFYFSRIAGQKKYFKNSVISLYNLATSKLVIVDDHFFAINALYYKKKRNKVIQIWHAAGTMKQFGNYEGNNTLIPHKNYDYVFVNKESDREIYARSLGVAVSQTIVTGSLQLFYMYEKSKETREVKEQIFYAPTYRSGKNDYSKRLVRQMIQSFEENSTNSDKQLKISLHPYVDSTGIDPNYLVDTDDFYDELLVSKILITDYSSLIIDFSILHRPIYLYMPDYETYKEQVGFLSANLFQEYPFPKITEYKNCFRLFGENNYDFFAVDKITEAQLTMESKNALKNAILLIEDLLGRKD